MENIYADIAARTEGNIYIGVVGPVRTGKSTLIKRIMEQLVIPGIEDPYRRERARDELPQSGSGKTIMTSEPKFVPEEAVEICPDGASRLRIRMIDSVGYMVEGASGAMEDGEPRMVTTPWYDHEIPMTEAAELGTKKVMQEHCTMGLVVTTDGTVTDIPRQDYIDAEQRAILDMQETGKPFLVIINSRDPEGQAARETRQYLAQTFGVEPAIADCQSLDTEEIKELLRDILYAFPLDQLQIWLPRWVNALENDHPIKKALCQGLCSCLQDAPTLSKAGNALETLRGIQGVQELNLKNIDPSTGTVSVTVSFPEQLFYEVLSARAGMDIQNDGQLLTLLSQLRQVKQEYDKLSGALESVEATGYGIVMPTAGDMTLYPPEMQKKGAAHGVKLRSTAPSIHMIRVDIDTEISPMVGSEQQSRELVEQLSGEDPEQLLSSNIFGKSVYDLLQEGLNAKLTTTPADVQAKFRGTLTRIVNEGATGLICLIL